MPRQLSTEFLRSAYAQEAGVCPIFLITITHDALSVPIRVSSDPTQRISETPADIVYGTVSRGENYIFFPFTLTLPSDEDDGPQNMELALDNVHRDYVATLRSIVGPPRITTEIVLSGTPDVVEAQWPEFLLINAKYDDAMITGTLMLETLYREPFPALAFSPSFFGALF